MDHPSGDLGTNHLLECSVTAWTELRCLVRHAGIEINETPEDQEGYLTPHKYNKLIYKNSINSIESRRFLFIFIIF